MGRRATVLVVEDEQLLLDVISDELEDGGFRVLQATTGEAAVALLPATEHLDLLLTDIRLPGGMDGWSVAERARVTFPALAVIYVTGYSHVEPRQVKGSVLLRKPYLPSQIIETARKLGIG
jgi:CheY-like chemotaxis protein